jgi:hypothetical protein
MVAWRALGLALAFIVLGLANPTQADEVPGVSPEDVPIGPAWLEAHRDDMGAVWLMWESVEGAESYNVYRDAELIAVVFGSTFHDTQPPTIATTYRVTATLAGVESTPALAVVIEIAVVDNAIDNVGYMLNLDPDNSVRLETTWCVPIGIGGDVPFFRIDSNCLDGVLP